MARSAQTPQYLNNNLLTGDEFMDKKYAFRYTFKKKLLFLADLPELS